MKKGYTVTFRFKSPEAKVISDVPIEAAGYSLIECVGAKGRHAQQHARITVRRKDVLDSILLEEELIEASIFNAETEIFQGVIKPYLSIGVEYNYIEGIDLDVLDYTELLRQEIFKDPSTYQGGKKLDDKILLERQWKDVYSDVLIRDLFQLSGVLDKVTLSEIPSHVLIKHFALKDGDQLDKAVDQLLFELFLDYRFTPGSVEIISTKIQEAEREVTQMNLQLKVSKEETTKDGVKISYPRYNSGLYELYREDTRFDDEKFKHLIHSTIETGYYWSGEMHPSSSANNGRPTKKTCEWDFTQFHNAAPGAEIINVHGFEYDYDLSDESGVDTSFVFEKADQTGAIVAISYAGVFDVWWTTGWGFSYVIRGIIDYKEPSEIAQIEGLDPEKISCKYIDNFDAANAFAKAFCARQKAAGLSFDFHSREELIPGHFYLLKDHDVTGIENTIRVISSSYNSDTGIYHYKAEGANAIKIGEVITRPSVASRPSGSVPQKMEKLFYLMAPRSIFLMEEKNAVVNVSAEGMIFVRDVKPHWFLNGATVGDMKRQLSFPASEMRTGMNLIECKTSYEGVPYERSIELVLTRTGEGTIIQYRWGKDPQNPPITEGGLWFWNGRVIFHDGQVVGNLNSEEWKAIVPQGPAGYPYLWMRVTTDGGNNWSYTRLPGKDDISFRIESNVTGYPWNVRGAVVAPTRVVMRAVKQNTVNVCRWSVFPVIAEPFEGDVFKFDIPVGMKDKEVVVTAEVSGLPAQKFILRAQETGSKIPMYVGDSFTLEELEALPVSPMGVPWILGDHAVVVVKVTEGDKVYNDPIPYVYHEDPPHWRKISGNDKNYSQAWNNTVVDVLKQPDKKLTTKAVYGIFEQLAAVDAFIRFLRVYHILMDPGDFYFEIKGVDEEGNILQTPVFEVSWRGKNLFKINFSANAPEVIIGDYDGTGAGGIKWNAGTNTLDIRGKGQWGGLLNTPTIRTEVGGDFWVEEPDVDSLAEIKQYIQKCGGTPGQWVPLGGTFHGVALKEGKYEETKIWHHQWYRTSPAPFGQTWYWGDSATVWTRTTSLKDVNGTITEFVERASWWTNNMNRGSGSLDYPPYREGPFPTAHKYTETDIDNYGTKTDTYPDTETSKLAGIGPSERPWTSEDIITGFGHWNTAKERLFFENLPNECPPEKNAVYREGPYLMISPGK